LKKEILFSPVLKIRPHHADGHASSSPFSPV
jgi:hypothetical protein